MSEIPLKAYILPKAEELELTESGFEGKLVELFQLLMTIRILEVLVEKNPALAQAKEFRTKVEIALGKELSLQNITTSFQQVPASLTKTFRNNQNLSPVWEHCLTTIAQNQNSQKKREKNLYHQQCEAVMRLLQYALECEAKVQQKHYPRQLLVPLLLEYIQQPTFSRFFRDKELPSPFQITPPTHQQETKLQETVKEKYKALAKEQSITLEPENFAILDHAPNKTFLAEILELASINFPNALLFFDFYLHEFNGIIVMIELEGEEKKALLRELETRQRNFWQEGSQIIAEKGDFITFLERYKRESEARARMMSVFFECQKLLGKFIDIESDGETGTHTEVLTAAQENLKRNQAQLAVYPEAVMVPEKLGDEMEARIEKAQNIIPQYTGEPVIMIGIPRPELSMSGKRIGPIDQLRPILEAIIQANAKKDPVTVVIWGEIQAHNMEGGATPENTLQAGNAENDAVIFYQQLVKNINAKALVTVVKGSEYFTGSRSDSADQEKINQYKQFMKYRVLLENLKTHPSFKQVLAPHRILPKSRQGNDTENNNRMGYFFDEVAGMLAKMMSESGFFKFGHFGEAINHYDGLAFLLQTMISNAEAWGVALNITFNKKDNDHTEDWLFDLENEKALETILRISLYQISDYLDQEITAAQEKQQTIQAEYLTSMSNSLFGKKRGLFSEAIKEPETLENYLSSLEISEEAQANITPIPLPAFPYFCPNTTFAYIPVPAGKRGDAGMVFTSPYSAGLAEEWKVGDLLESQQIFTLNELELIALSMYSQLSISKQLEYTKASLNRIIEHFLRTAKTYPAMLELLTVSFDDLIEALNNAKTIHDLFGFVVKYIVPIMNQDLSRKKGDDPSTNLTTCHYS